MNQRIDETLLLGYLLNSLEPEEQAQIERAIAADPTVRDRLDKLREDFQGLLDSANDDIPEPRGDLASVTMNAINDGNRRIELQKPSRWCRFLERTRCVQAMSVEDSEPRGRLGLFCGAVEVSVLAVCILVFGTVIISNTHFAREQARQQACGHQLMRFGRSIQDYAFHGRRQVAPEIEAYGPFSFAGMYSVKLNERRLLNSDDSLWCPSVGIAQTGVPVTSVESLPSLRQLMNAKIDELEMWKRWLGGSYAYNLGVMMHGEYTMPRYLSRPEFAIMGDSPTMEDGELVWRSHGMNRCNILYEDGRVVLRVCGPDVDFANHPYLNDKGELKAGCNKDDSAMGPSFFGPLEDLNVYRVEFLK